MKNVIQFFIHSFMFLYLFTNKKNQIVMCNLSDKNNKNRQFTSIQIFFNV